MKSPTSVSKMKTGLHSLLRLSLLLLLALSPCGTFGDSALRTLQSAIGNPYLFQGARYDAETGFYYFRNRYYDPRAGRFLQRDPVWDPLNLGNAYNFGANSPVSSADPTGEGIFIPFLIAMGVVGGISFFTGDIAAQRAEQQRNRSVLEMEKPFDWDPGRSFKQVPRGVLFGETLAISVCLLRHKSGAAVVLAVSTAKTGQGLDQALFQGDVEGGWRSYEEAQAALFGGGVSGAQRMNPKLDPLSSGRNRRALVLPALGEPTPSGFESAEAYRSHLGWGIRAERARNWVRGSIARDIERERPQWERAVEELRAQGVFTSQEAEFILGRIEAYIEACQRADIFLSIRTEGGNVSLFGRRVLRPRPELGIPRGREPGEGSVAGGSPEEYGLESIPLGPERAQRIGRGGRRGGDTEVNIR